MSEGGIGESAGGGTSAVTGAPAAPASASAPRRGSRLSRIGWRFALLIAGLLVASAITTTWFSVVSLYDTTTESALSAMASTHEIVADLVDTSWTDVQAYRDSTLEQRKTELRDISSAMVGAMDRLRLATSPDGTNDDAAKAAVLDLLRSTRYRNKDYFFTLDRDLVMIEHPDPAWDGRPVADVADPNGVYLFREMRDAVATKGSGFVPYAWARLGTADPVPKISFVEPYTPWGWIVGTGVYLDDIEAEADARIEATKAQLTDTFSRIRFGDTGLLFLLDGDGSLIITPAQADLSWLSTTDAGRALVASILATAPPGDDTMHEVVAAAPFRGDPSAEWRLEISRFTGPGWVLVSAVPEAALRAPGVALGIRQLLLSLLVLIAGLGIGLVASRRIVRPVEAMTAAAVELENDRFDPSSLDEAAARTDEVGALARAFRRMGAEVIERERRLREQVARLTVTIDRGRVEREVGEITDSDFFRDLQSRAREMRRRDRPDEEG